MNGILTAVDFAAVALIRVTLAVTLSLSIMAIGFPGKADISVPHQQKCCCSHSEQQNHDNGCGDPAKPAPDPQCCNGCPFGLAVVPSEPGLRIFGTPDGERLLTNDVFLTWRTDRPPVPPPRV